MVRQHSCVGLGRFFYILFNRIYILNTNLHWINNSIKHINKKCSHYPKFACYPHKWKALYTAISQLLSYNPCISHITVKKQSHINAVQGYQLTDWIKVTTTVFQSCNKLSYLKVYRWIGMFWLFTLYGQLYRGLHAWICVQPTFPSQQSCCCFESAYGLFFLFAIILADSIILFCTKLSTRSLILGLSALHNLETPISG